MTQPPHAWYKIYGGKLAGILTQSFCREMFFDSLRLLLDNTRKMTNIKLIGQFHDEIVMEWHPSSDVNAVDFPTVLAQMDYAMTQTVWPDFPLAAEIKHDYRYTK